MEFSRQESWSGLPFPSPEDLPDPGIEPGSPALQADTLRSEPPGTSMHYTGHISFGQGWFPLELTGLLSLRSKELSRVSSSTTIQKLLLQDRIKEEERELGSLVEGSAVSGRVWESPVWTHHGANQCSTGLEATGDRKCLESPTVGRSSRAHPYGGIFCSCEKSHFWKILNITI